MTLWKRKEKKLFEEIYRHRNKVKHILFSVRCNCWVGFQLLSYRYKVKHILWEMCYCLVTGVRDVLLLGYRYKVNTFCLVWDVIAELAFNCLVGIFNWYVLILLGHILHIVGNVYSKIAVDSRFQLAQLVKSLVVE